MPKFDLTITISVIVALAAIVSPILTAIINNHYALKMKRMELKQQEYAQKVAYKREIFENYLRHLSAAYHSPESEDFIQYARNYQLAYMYLPEELRAKMSRVNHMFSRSVEIEIVDDIDELSAEISAILQTM